MADYPGDPTKQPPECKDVFTPFSDSFPRDPMVDGPFGSGRWSKCPNLKERDDTSMEAETWECSVCGKSYKLHYEDMA
jgi:hypothetical protein